MGKSEFLKKWSVLAFSILVVFAWGCNNSTEQSADETVEDIVDNAPSDTSSSDTSSSSTTTTSSSDDSSDDEEEADVVDLGPLKCSGVKSAKALKLDFDDSGVMNIIDIFDEGPKYLTSYGGGYYFYYDASAAFGDPQGRQLWKVSGTDETATPARLTGTSQNNDNSLLHAAAGFSLPKEGEFDRPIDPVVFKSEFYFIANDNGNSENYQLWKTNGSSVTKVTGGGGDIEVSGNEVTNLTVLGDYIYFAAKEDSSGQLSLFRTNGTPDTAELITGTEGFKPYAFKSFGGKLYFIGDGDEGEELYSYDPDPNGDGLTRITDINDGGDSFSIDDDSELLKVSGKLYFVADDGTDALLYESDGTANGTVPVTKVGTFRYADIDFNNYDISGFPNNIPFDTHSPAENIKPTKKIVNAGDAIFYGYEGAWEVQNVAVYFPATSLEFRFKHNYEPTQGQPSQVLDGDATAGDVRMFFTTEQLADSSDHQIAFGIPTLGVEGFITRITAEGMVDPNADYYTLRIVDAKSFSAKSAVISTVVKEESSDYFPALVFIECN